MAKLVMSQPDGTLKVIDTADKEPISDEMMAILKELTKDLKWEIVPLEKFMKLENKYMDQFEVKERLKAALAIMDESGRRMPQSGDVGTYGLWEHEWNELRDHVFFAFEALVEQREN